MRGRSPERSCGWTAVRTWADGDGCENRLSLRPHRGHFDLLSGSRAEAGAHHLAAARLAFLIAHVRTAVRPSVGCLSPGGAGLPGIWAQRVAGSEVLSVHL